MTAPPIPVACQQRPTTRDGLVIPHANVQLADGGCDFRSHHHARWLDCWERGVCQVCGDPLQPPAVLLCGPRQLRQLLFDEPPLHPACARYVTQACPMVAGQREHYATGPSVSERSRGQHCPDPGCDCGGWIRHPGTSSPSGGPAHEWYAIWVRDWQLAATPDQRITGGMCWPAQVVRVRLVSRPGAGAVMPWVPVDYWAERYQPLDLVTAEQGADRA